MFIRDNKRINIHAGITVNGIQYPAGSMWDADLRDRLGISEVEDPVRGDERYYINQEVDEAPWLIVTPRPLEDVKAMVLAAINAECEQRMAEIRSSYPDSEVLSWPKQEAEARAYLSDQNGEYPLIQALAANRQIPIADLAERVVQKADAYAALSGQVIGIRQRLEDALELAETLEDVIAIKWPADEVEE